MTDPTLPWGAAGAVEAPVVHTDRGAVRGLRRPGSDAYVGIPFAAPPVGEHRFSAPAVHAAWEGVRPATRYGATPQRRPFGELTTIPEPSIPGPSTLNVNVFTPAAGDRDARLPVFVWIHGGGYFAGSPASPWYDGRAFNRDGIVTVTVSYRLGFDGFGWVDGSDAPLNRGLLDQIAALEWVQRNIEAFGGDPARVVIGGQSAGGGSVQALLVSPRAMGLFRGVVSHSGGIGGLTSDDVIPVARRFAAGLGIPATLEGWRGATERQVLDGERAFNSLGGVMGGGGPVDVVALVAASRTGLPAARGLVWAPVVDGDVLTAAIDDAVLAGAGAGVPLLEGTTRNEFAFPSDGPDVDEITAGLRAAGLSEAAVAAWRGEVATIGGRYALSQVMTDVGLRAGAVRLAASRTAAGEGSRTWAFDFAGRSGLDGLSAHCFDLPFAWDLLDAEGVTRVLGGSPSQGLADAVHGDWVRFLRDGSLPWPTAEDEPAGARRYEGDGVVDDAESYRLEAEAGGVLRPEREGRADEPMTKENRR